MNIRVYGIAGRGTALIAVSGKGSFYDPPVRVRFHSYGNMAMITTMLFRVSHLTLPHLKSTSWLVSGATNCRTLTMLPFQGSLCSFLCFVNVDISRLNVRYPLKCFFAISLGLEMQSMLQKLDQIDYASLRSEPLTKICRN